MLTEEIISMVKSNIHHYECTSLANDDVERLFVVIERMQKQNDKLKKGLSEARNIILFGENMTPQAEERTEITEEKPLKEVRQ